MRDTDRTLTCLDCGRSFVFSAGEQEFFAGKGFENAPGRCHDCRAARRRHRSGHHDPAHRPRRMYPAVCASCGENCEVPFEPVSGRAAYCCDCYSTAGPKPAA